MSFTVSTYSTYYKVKQLDKNFSDERITNLIADALTGECSL